MYRFFLLLCLLVGGGLGAQPDQTPVPWHPLQTTTFLPVPNAEPTWQPGYVRTVAGEWRSVDALRFDMLKHRLETIEDGKTQFYDPVVLPEFILMDDEGQMHRFIRTPYPHLFGPQLAFMEVASEGPRPVLLFRKPHMRIAHRNSIYTLQNDETAQEIATDLYTFDDRGRLVRIPRRRKAALRLFGEHQEAIQYYAAQHRLHFRSPQHLARMVVYYNALVMSERHTAAR
ncbi:hypothetical protein SAMN05421823_11657 [Catalinimonas alkaloidigena]|uniref:Uncharacterized protein n=1 Tax=Catalinimonas alkaloidigena TaxID=1075417 RepID=A0A1G9UGE0_9BACT|nr:hypothetical protein [Catalinimonas alkaloidigena]SDM59020.1 hypothetical protein SAMN05421823_11657 [Catalinimonas alkaloidigena]